MLKSIESGICFSFRIQICSPWFLQNVYQSFIFKWNQHEAGYVFIQLDKFFASRIYTQYIYGIRPAFEFISEWKNLIMTNFYWAKQFTWHLHSSCFVSNHSQSISNYTHTLAYILTPDWTRLWDRCTSLVAINSFNWFLHLV